MEIIRPLLNRAIDIMEQDNRGVQIGCYTIAVAGLTLALRRVRPFTRFCRPTDIPKHFLKERRELRGFVERIEPGGALLMVRHEPLVNVPLPSSGELPVKIAGVNISGLGVNWLQSIIAGQNIRFIPVATTPEYVRCEVLLDQTRDGKPTVLNVGESLVMIGFGCVALNEPIDKTYTSQLEQAHNYALRRKLGFRYYVKPVQSVLNLLGKQIGKAAASVGRQLVNAPKLAAP